MSARGALEGRSTSWGALRMQKDPLQGFPSKATILGMRRRELEALVAKFPSALPPGHASVERCMLAPPHILLSLCGAGALS